MRWVTRMVCVVMSGAVIGLSALTLLAAPASAEPRSEEAEFIALTNELRLSKGLVPLAVDSQLTDVARMWSGVMAQQSNLYHNPNLSTDVSNWKMLGENVGEGPSVASIEAAFVASPHHYENLTNPGYRYVGIGVVDTDGVVWVTVDFKTARSALAVPVVSSVNSPAPRPTPPKPPAAAPKPAPVAAPRAVPAAAAAVQAVGHATTPALRPAGEVSAVQSVDPLTGASGGVTGRGSHPLAAIPASNSRLIGMTGLALSPLLLGALLFLVVRRRRRAVHCAWCRRPGTLVPILHQAEGTSETGTLALCGVCSDLLGLIQPEPGLPPRGSREFADYVATRQVTGRDRALDELIAA